VLPVVGMFKDFASSANNTAALSYVTLANDLNFFLIHDLKIPFVTVFSILSVIMILIAKYVENEIYRPLLHGIIRYLIDFEKDFHAKCPNFVGFKDGVGAFYFEGIYAHLKDIYISKKINELIK
jgi:hypothetical protein